MELKTQISEALTAFMPMMLLSLRGKTPSFFEKFPLTTVLSMVVFPQQTRQASILRDTLNSGGFLFSSLAGALP
jgi:hypothetical protein